MEVPDLPFDALVLVLASAGHARLRTVSRDWRDAVQAARAHRLWFGTAAGALAARARSRTSGGVDRIAAKSPLRLRVLPAQQPLARPRES